MENKVKNTVNGFTIFLVYVQIVLAIITGIVFIMYLFNREMLTILQMCLGITLLFMSFLSSSVYNKSKFTFLCLVFGLLLIIFNILRLAGVL